MSEFHTKSRRDFESLCESDYMRATTSGDRPAQVKAIVNLMEIKAIQPSDNRLKLLETEKSIITNRDYRRTKSFSPKWFYYNYRPVISFKMECRAHEGERREGAYAGKINFPARSVKIVAKEISETKQLENAFEKMLKIMKARGSSKHLGKTTLERMVDGEYLVYQTSISSGEHCMHSEFGYVIVAISPKTESILLIPILDWAAIDECYANHNVFQENILNLIEEGIRMNNEGKDIRIKLNDVM